MVSSAAFPQPQPSSGSHFPMSRVGPTPCHLITTAASLRLSHFLHHRFRLGFLLHSSFKNISRLFHVPRLKDQWQESAIKFEGFNFLQWSSDAFATTSLYSFGGEGNRDNSGASGKSYFETSRRISQGRQWTNVLLAINILVYVAQVATQGKLLLWGAKINSLIDKGQIWRLATSSILHANIGHLLVNCYSLNSIGPTVEAISGPKRFLSVYITSAIASSAMSYWLCKAPAVGASGAIFGLVGSFAVFILRHRDMVKGSKGDLQHIANVIVLNMVIGIMSKGIDNWGHLGGLIGGVAISWLLGPAWRYESLSNGGRRVFADKAPIFSIIKPKRKH